MNSLWEGPAAAAYQSRMAEDIENALQVCTELAEYVSCMEYASREYVKLRAVDREHCKSDQSLREGEKRWTDCRV